MKNTSFSRRPPASPRWRRRLPCLLGFVVLSAMLLTLYGFSVQQAWFLHPGSGLVVGLPLAAVLLALVRERDALLQAQSRSLLCRPALLDFAGVVGGALVTYLLSVDLELGAVTASGLIGLLGALIFPKQAVPIYCGSFVGMSSVALLATYPEMLVAGMAAGLIYNLAASVLNGFGGKLGTIAFAAAVVTGLGLRREFIVAEIPSGPLAWQILLYATAAAVLTYWLSVTLKHGAVIGSSVVGLVGGLLLPALLPDQGPLLAVVVICASFTGMSSPDRIPNYLWMTLAGVITGLIFIYSLPVLGGAGGKLGTIAFGAAMATWAFRSLVVGVTGDG